MFKSMSLNRGRTMKVERGGWRPLRREELRYALVQFKTATNQRGSFLSPLNKEENLLRVLCAR
jgi:hypothetical protein